MRIEEFSKICGTKIFVLRQYDKKRLYLVRLIQITISLLEVKIKILKNRITTVFKDFLIGATRFERATLCSQSRCATELRYAPKYLMQLLIKRVTLIYYNQLSRLSIGNKKIVLN